MAEQPPQWTEVACDDEVLVEDLKLPYGRLLRVREMSDGFSLGAPGDVKSTAFFFYPFSVRTTR